MSRLIYKITATQSADWDSLPDGTNLGDDLDNTGYVIEIPSGGASVLVTQSDDGRIPSGSTITSVQIIIRVRRDQPEHQGPSLLYPVIKHSGSTVEGSSISTGSLTQGVMTDVLLGTFTTDAHSVAWTPTTFFNHTYGLRGEISTNSVVRVVEIKRYLNFSLAAPSATTLGATDVTQVAAKLRGTINPNGATASYPVSYKFQWGLTTSYGNETTVGSGNTGSANISVEANLSSLVPNTVYHFRVVAYNADTTTNGDDMTFVTGMGEPTVLIF